MKTALLLLPVVLVLGVSACASTQGGTRRPSNIITHEEIEASNLVFTDAYDVVRHFKPNWLVKRGTVNLDSGGGLDDYVVIYLDETRLGDPESLRTISAMMIREIQHYDAAQSLRLGPHGHPHGAIVVRTKTGAE